MFFTKNYPQWTVNFMGTTVMSNYCRCSILCSVMHHNYSVKFAEWKNKKEKTSASVELFSSKLHTSTVASSTPSVREAVVGFHVSLPIDPGLFKEWLYFLSPSSALRISKQSPSRRHAGMVFATIR